MADRFAAEPHYRTQALGPAGVSGHDHPLVSWPLSGLGLPPRRGSWGALPLRPRRLRHRRPRVPTTMSAWTVCQRGGDGAALRTSAPADRSFPKSSVAATSPQVSRSTHHQQGCLARLACHWVGSPPSCLDKGLPVRTWRLRGLYAKIRGPCQDKSDRVVVWSSGRGQVCVFSCLWVAAQVVQFAATEPEDFAAAGLAAEALGADGVDLNLGCPQARTLSPMHFDTVPSALPAHLIPLLSPLPCSPSQARARDGRYGSWLTDRKDWGRCAAIVAVGLAIGETTSFC